MNWKRSASRDLLFAISGALGLFLFKAQFLYFPLIVERPHTCPSHLNPILILNPWLFLHSYQKNNSKPVLKKQRICTQECVQTASLEVTTAGVPKFHRRSFVLLCIRIRTVEQRNKIESKDLLYGRSIQNATRGAYSMNENESCTCSRLPLLLLLLLRFEAMHVVARSKRNTKSADCMRPCSRRSHPIYSALCIYYVQTNCHNLSHVVGSLVDRRSHSIYSVNQTASTWSSVV